MQRISSFILLILFSFYAAVAEGSEFTVETSSGNAKGLIKEGVINWDDIPYAKPPIGDLRWRAPQLLFNNYNNQIIPRDNNFCVQEPSDMGGAPGEEKVSGTEDCLYLDVKAPKEASDQLLPVMFWIHGGGNTSVKTSIKDIDGINYDVLCVKGSGWDMAEIEPAGLPAVKLKLASILSNTLPNKCVRFFFLKV